MTTVTAGRVTRRRECVPRWPTFVLVAYATLATLSILQGVADIVLPALLGGEPFGLLFGFTARFGPGFLWAYVLVHNLGLACLVPGIGFVAAWFEKRTVNRGRIGLLLAGAVVLSLLTGLQYLLMAHERFNLLVALPLFLAEAAAVLLVAVPAARELRGFVPTPEYAWSLVHPFRNLRTPFLASLALLTALAGLEALLVTL